MSAERLSILPASKKRPCVCLGDVNELLGTAPSDFAQAIPENYGNRHLLRKWWEWEYLAECAKLCGCLEGKGKAIGVGVGEEPLIFYFARFCPYVLATDLYSSESAWKEARFASADAVYQASPIDYPRKRVEVRNADMRKLGVPDGSFDFAWSCSSIEHVPTLRDLLEVFRELARVLRIGGHALLTTEYCLSQPPYLLPGVNALDEQLFWQIVGALDAFDIVGEVDLNYNWMHPANAARPRRYLPPGLIKTPQSGLSEAFRVGQMANTVGISLIAPIAFVLRRRQGTVPSWDDLELPDSVRDFTAAVAALQRGEVDGIVDMLRPYVHSKSAEISLQFYTLMFRFYVEAMALDPQYDRSDVHRAIEEFLRHLPQGELQDGDCLDLVGYLLYECGDYANSARVCRLAAASPSTTDEHALRLGLDYLRSMLKLGRFEEGAEFVVKIYRDLLINGCVSEGLAMAWAEGLGRAGLSAHHIRLLTAMLEHAVGEAQVCFNEAVSIVGSTKWSPIWKGRLKHTVRSMPVVGSLAQAIWKRFRQRKIQ